MCDGSVGRRSAGDGSTVNMLQLRDLTQFVLHWFAHGDIVLVWLGCRVVTCMYMCLVALHPSGRQNTSWLLKTYLFWCVSVSLGLCTANRGSS